MDTFLFRRDVGAIARMLIKTADAAVTCQNLEALYDTVYEALKTVYDIDTAYLLLYQENQNSLTIRWFKHAGGQPFDKSVEEKRNKILCLDVIRQKKAVVIQAEDAQADGFGSLVRLPLENKGNVPGVLVLKNDSSRAAFHDTDLEALTAVAGILAVSMAKDEKEKELREIEKINQVVFEVTTAIYTEEKLEDLFSFIHQSLGRIIDVTNFYIALYDKETKALTFPFYRDEFDDVSAFDIMYLKTNSLTNEVFEALKPVFLRKEDLDLRAAQGKIVGTKPLIWIGIPLLIRGQVRGTMVVQSYSDPYLYDMADVTLLNSFSEQVAIAIDRTRSFERQAESEKKFRQLFNHVADPIIVFARKTHRFFDCNNAFLNIYGYTREEFLNMTAYDLHPLEDLAMVREKLGTLNKHTSNRYTHQTKDKMRFSVAIRTEATEYNGQPAFISTIRDITEYLKLENELREHQDHLEKLVKKRTDELESMIGTKKEMEIAKNIQTSLLPSLSKFDASGFEISANMTPAEDVGGDYYDVIKAPDNRLWFGIGDVTGHGLISGLIMMMAQVSINTLIRSIPGISPEMLLIHANEVMQANIREGLKVDHHMTISFIVEEKEGKYRYAGAHETILIFRAAAGIVEQIPTKGMWLGIIPDISKPTKKYAGEFYLEKNDLLCLYTDGVIEVCNEKREQYDMKRLEVFLKGHSTLPTEIIKHRLLAELNQYMEHQMDDITFLIMRKR